jgi:hypothetical protein
MADLFVADSPAQVRSAIDLRIDAAMLPNEVIEQPIFVDEAIEEVLVADPAAATYLDPSVQLDRVRRACVYLTGARLCPVLPSLLSLQLGDTRFQWGAWDGEKRAAELRGLAAAALALNTETDGLVPLLQQFTTAAGYRGR